MRMLTLALLFSGCKGSEEPDDPGLVDADGDGRTPNAGDCDDSDPTIGPDAPEIWYDGIDQDCDGADDDQDGDGFELADDCDDTNSDIGPGNLDTLGDGIDIDCDGGDAGGFQIIGLPDQASTIGPVLALTPAPNAFVIQTDGPPQSGQLRAQAYGDDLDEVETRAISLDNGSDTPAYRGPLVAMEELTPSGFAWAGVATLGSTSPGAYIGLAADGGAGWARFDFIDATRVTVDKNANIYTLAYCGPNGTKIWRGDSVALTDLTGLELHFSPNAGSEGCQATENVVTLIEGGDAVQYTLNPAGGAMTEVANLGSGYTDALGSEGVLVLVTTTGIEIYEGGTPLPVAIADVASVAVSRFSATEWAIATTDATGAVTLRVGDPAQPLEPVSIPGPTATDSLSVLHTGDGVMVGARNGVDAWVSRTLVP